MSQQLLVEISENSYAALHRHAAEQGLSPEAVIADWVEQRFSGNGAGGPANDSTEGTTAPAKRGNMRRWFGSIDLGRPIGTDNEQIDADLAKEYGSTHEDE